MFGCSVLPNQCVLRLYTRSSQSPGIANTMPVSCLHAPMADSSLLLSAYESVCAVSGRKQQTFGTHIQT